VEVKLMLAEVLEKTNVGDEAAIPWSKIRSIVTEALEDGMLSTRKAVKYGRYVAEDALEEAQHKVKQRPFQAMSIALAAGVLIGGLLSWIEFRGR